MAMNKYLSIITLSSGWCSSVDWVQALEPKGCWFDSRSGHMPGLKARSPVGDAWEVTTQWCFSPSLSPSLPPSLKTNLKKKVFKMKKLVWISLRRWLWPQTYRKGGCDFCLLLDPFCFSEAMWPVLTSELREEVTTSHLGWSMWWHWI